jgi:hypothetical protein
MESKPTEEDIERKLDELRETAEAMLEMLRLSNERYDALYGNPED